MLMENGSEKWIKVKVLLMGDLKKKPLFKKKKFQMVFRRLQYPHLIGCCNYGCAYILSISDCRQNFVIVMDGSFVEQEEEPSVTFLYLDSCEGLVFNHHFPK